MPFHVQSRKDGLFIYYEDVLHGKDRTFRLLRDGSAVEVFYGKKQTAEEPINLASALAEIVNVKLPEPRG